MILLIVGVAAAAAFATWWFMLRENAIPDTSPIRRPETFDAAVLRDSRFSALRAPAAVQPPSVRGRANPFRVATGAAAETPPIQPVTP